MDPRDVAGVLAAWSVSIAALLVVLNPEPVVRAGMALITPLIVLLAFYGSTRTGACPQCGAPKRRQSAQHGEPEVTESGQAGVSPGGVLVELGWEVVLPTAFDCGRCEQTWQAQQAVFVSRTDAATKSEALVLARDGLPG